MKIDSIQFLRAIAATLVVYAHSIDLTKEFGWSHQENYHHLNEIGCIGVDLFFVISGFIITYVADQYRGARGGLRFLQNRFYRINPIYYIASVVFLGCTLLTTWIIERSFPFDSKQLLQSAIDTLIIIPVTDAQFLFNPILIIGWTLAFEWLFYILFFFTILLKVRRKIFLLAVFIVLLVAIRYIILPFDLRLTFLTNPIVLEFLLGVVICQLYQNFQNVPRLIPIALLIIAITWFVLLIGYTNPHMAELGPILSGSLSMDRFLTWGIPSGCLTAACVYLEQAGRLKLLWRNRLCRLLGDASYSIYLVHLSAFSLLTIIYKETGFFLTADVSIFFQVLVGLGTGVAFYWWIENPFLKWLNSSSSRMGSGDAIITQPQTN